MPSDKRNFGDIGEREAKKFLEDRGYRIIEKNYRIKNIGEIDLVAKKKGKIVFFEVKTRHSEGNTDFPIEFSINQKKRHNLKKICSLYLIEKRNTVVEWQVDAIFIKVGKENKSIIEHMENILWDKYY